MAGVATEYVARSPMDILDVGTGTGFLALLLAELGHRVVAIDLADAMTDSGTGS
jgi:2-polyprenyl-3-methyl-5-hydroxy-6-metoxy-1,4-benzoquinol methylase